MSKNSYTNGVFEIWLMPRNKRTEQSRPGERWDAILRASCKDVLGTVSCK